MLVKQAGARERRGAGAMDGQYDLERFRRAQAASYATALAEIRAGRKMTHWIWYIFPQLRGLGQSPMSDFYGISDAGEARAYLADPLLGPRLHEMAGALLDLDASDPKRVMGRPDDLKLCSCMTLFEVASGGKGKDAVFGKVLEKYYHGRRDARTLEMLGTEQL